MTNFIDLSSFTDFTTMPSAIRDRVSTLTPRERKYFRTMWPKSGVLYITSKPGIAKSAIARTIADKMGFRYMDLRLSMADETDFKFPFLKDENYDGKDIKVSGYAVPEWAFEANQQPTIIHFEELNRAPQFVRNAALQILLERQIGDFKFSNTVLMMASGNLGDEDGTDVEEFDNALNNRLVHYSHTLSANEWIDGFAKDNVHNVILSYIKSYPEKLYQNPTENTKAFATPRSWTFVSEMLPQEGEEISQSRLHDLIAGTVGDGVATKFMAHRALSSKLPVPSDILDGTVTTLSTEAREISAMFSLTTSLCYELKDFVDRNGKDKMDELYSMANNFFKFMMENFDTEMTVLGGRTALKVYKLPLEPRKVPCIEDFFKKHGKLIIEAHNA
mgnify:CR=1 FL=1